MFCGDTGLPGVPLMLQTVLAAQALEHGGVADGVALRFSFEVAVVSAGLGGARTGAVLSSPLPSRSSTLNIAGDLTGKGSTSHAWGSATA
jgi:hypothetical protein